MTSLAAILNPVDNDPRRKEVTVPDTYRVKITTLEGKKIGYIQQLVPIGYCPPDKPGDALTVKLNSSTEGISLTAVTDGIRVKEWQWSEPAYLVLYHWKTAEDGTMNFTLDVRTKAGTKSIMRDNSPFYVYPWRISHNQPVDGEVELDILWKTESGTVHRVAAIPDPLTESSPAIQRVKEAGVETIGTVLCVSVSGVNRRQVDAYKARIVLEPITETNT